jgi:hypothetical protein
MTKDVFAANNREESPAVNVALFMAAAAGFEGKDGGEGSLRPESGEPQSPSGAV